MSDNPEADIAAIKERNARVERDKAWETSKFRTACICLLTYLLIWLLMAVIGIEKPFLAALIPTTGFFLSTLSLRFAKKIWIAKFYKS